MIWRRGILLFDRMIWRRGILLFDRIIWRRGINWIIWSNDLTSRYLIIWSNDLTSRYLIIWSNYLTSKYLTSWYLIIWSNYLTSQSFGFGGSMVAKLKLVCLSRRMPIIVDPFYKKSKKKRRVNGGSNYDRQIGFEGKYMVAKVKCLSRRGPIIVDPLCKKSNKKIVWIRGEVWLQSWNL